MAMPSESLTPNSEPANMTAGPAPAVLSGAVQTRATEKALATVRRHKEERRADRLDEMRVQIAEGTLVVRQMSVVEHDAARLVARDASARNETRLKLNRALRKQERALLG
jgi:anti-sigma28 factor (negative regulator of flagellin synthesis)